MPWAILASRPEVHQREVAILVNQQVLGFHIPAKATGDK
jgi:hypothetical protein